MYITITPQQTQGNYGQSVSGFVSYLEKENLELPLSQQEHFFNQYGDQIRSEEVIREIDKNTSKLSKREPKFYSITASPSKNELKQLANPSRDLNAYTKELMQQYVKSFNREIQGRKININDIKYFAKIEHQRYYKGTDREVIENQSTASKILELKHQIRKVERGEQIGGIRNLNRQIHKLEGIAPHQNNGKRIVQGMKKPGLQSHIHIIVSRKDASNSISLSPGSKYKASEVKLHGKLVKRGFNRDAFFENAEKVFDTKFSYNRNYVEKFQTRKTLVQNPKLYYQGILGLPTNEKGIALKLLGKSGMHLPQIPTNKVQLALKTIKALKRGVGVALKSSSIGI